MTPDQMFYGAVGITLVGWALLLGVPLWREIRKTHVKSPHSKGLTRRSAPETGVNEKTQTLDLGSEGMSARGRRPAPQVDGTLASQGPSDLAATPRVAPSPDPALSEATCEHGHPGPWCNQPAAAVRGDTVLCLYHAGMHDASEGER